MSSSTIIQIVRGSDVTLALKVRETVTQDPYDLTGKTITGKVIGESGSISITSDAFSVVDAELGKVQMTLSDTVTTQMKKGIQGFELILTEGSDVKIVQFLNRLDVRARL
jgi:hypothetical protein